MLFDEQSGLQRLTCRGTTHLKIESLCGRDVDTICQRCNDKTRTVAQVLVVIWDNSISDGYFGTLSVEDNLV